MKRHYWIKAGGILIVAGVLLLPAFGADFEVTGPDGRRILLKDDGTWRYVQSREKEAAKGKDKGKETAQEKPKDQAVLRLERKFEIGNSCRYELRLVNNLPYEIKSLVPAFSAYRKNGVVYDKV